MQTSTLTAIRFRQQTLATWRTLRPFRLGASWAYPVALCRTLCGDIRALYVLWSVREKVAAEGSSVRLSGRKEKGAVANTLKAPRNARFEARS